MMKNVPNKDTDMMNTTWIARLLFKFDKLLFFIVCAVVGGVALHASPSMAADDELEWKVTNMGAPINSEYNDGWATITGDGLTLYFASNRPGGLSPAHIEDGWYIGKDGTPTHYNIYVSHRKTRTSAWSEPKLLPKGINSPYSDHSALQSEDGHWLFFASDRPGGCGNLDVYVSHRDDIHDDMAWDQPRHLACEEDGGPNAAGIESCPNYDGHGHLYFTSAKDGNPANLDFKVADFDEKTGKAGPARTLPNSTPYFDGHIDPKHGYVWAGYPGGKGGSDIWQFENAETEHDPAKWVNPKDLPFPINTPYEDQMPASTSDGKILTFVSDRPGGMGGTDIYEAVRVKKNNNN
jgi:hypothetical protein